MAKGALNPSQYRTVQIIEKLVFGRIEQLLIQNGEPLYERATRIVQEIKLGSEPERRPDRSSADLTLKKEFESLFNHLTQIRDGIVDIEIRHSIPFKLVLNRSYTEFAVAPENKPS